MDDKFRVQLQPTCIVVVVEDEDDCRAAAADCEFYETIEAPKFVDFTRPNHFCPDDRYWFCSRLGCNQKHEEEMDSEAIYKDFVLRVMAARSPNVRFRRGALTTKPSSDSTKCPMSAPPKPSKSRIPRLALLSSISKKLIDDQERGKSRHATTKAAAIPKPRAKRLPAKCLTSPRKINVGSPQVKGFQSVRNSQKISSITLQKNRAVAKALLFSSPKKGIKPKPKPKASESDTPVTKLCQGLKKLTIMSEKKANGEKSAKGSTRTRQLLPSDTPRKPPTVSQAKTSKTVQSHDRKPGDDLSDMEIDEKYDKITPLTAGSLDGDIPSGLLATELVCVSDSQNRDSEQQKPMPLQELNPPHQSKGHTKSYSTEDDLENKDRPGMVGDGKLEDNDDKENTPNTNNNRNMNGSNVIKDGAPVKSKVKRIQKQVQTRAKTLGDNCPAVITEGVKYKKLKPTNPKPFRLRTDERGILREATLERKINSHQDSTTTSDNSQYTENGVAAVEEKPGKKIQDRISKKIPVKSKYKKTSKKEGEPLSDRGIVPCSENANKRIKSSSRPQRENKCQVKPRGLIVTEESTKTMRPKESRWRHELASQRRK